MPDGLYERDALAWAELQADLLTKVAVGERPNEPVDWAHVIAEVRDVGLSELHACESLLLQAMIHLLKLRTWPDSPAAPHRRGETVTFLGQARKRFTPSMRQRLDIDDVFADALERLAAEAEDAAAMPALPSRCPFALDDLLSPRRDVRLLVAALEAENGA